MVGEINLAKLLASMEPQLKAEEYVFYKGARYGDHADISPVASFLEREGLTLGLRWMAE